MNESRELIPVEVRDLVERQITALVGGTVITKIENNSQYVNADALLKEVKRYANKAENCRKKIVEPLNREVKRFNDYFREPAKSLSELESNIKVVIMDYNRRLEEERRRLQREADERARIEREKIERAAREKREAEEKARRQVEEALRRAKEAATREEREKALREADRAERQANKAAAVAETKEMVSSAIVAPIVTRLQPKLSGQSTVKKWRGEVYDTAELLRWIIEQGLTSIVTIDMRPINAQIAATAGIKQIPGVNNVHYEEMRTRTR